MPNRGEPIRRMLLFGLVACAAGIGPAGAPARADYFQFDPNGTQGAGLSIGGFDFSVGNTLLQKGIDQLRSSNPQPITVYYQATLAGLISPGGTTIVPSGLNRPGGFEITAVAKLNLDVASVTFAKPGDRTSDIDMATFVLSPNQQGSFFRLFSGPTVASNLAGTGFDSGKLVLEAKPFSTLDGSATFTSRIDRTTSTGMTSRMDQFGPDNFNNMQSVVRSGSMAVTSSIDYANPDFFRSPLPTPWITFNTTLTSPFNTTNPSQQFLGYNPALGTVNGRNGPDTVLQSDGNLYVVPEPSAMVLTGLGLAGLVAARRRARP